MACLIVAPARKRSSIIRRSLLWQLSTNFPVVCVGFAIDAGRCGCCWEVICDVTPLLLNWRWGSTESLTSSIMIHPHVTLFVGRQDNRYRFRMDLRHPEYWLGGQKPVT
jgi:hypothetical protein